MADAINDPPSQDPIPLTSLTGQPEKQNTTRSTEPRFRITLVMIALSMASFLAALDTVILTTALPTIVEDLRVSDAAFAWIGSAYLISAAALMPFWGRISDIFGRKPVLIAANLVFIAGSLVAALSKSLQMLLAGRAVQGLGAGGLMVLPNIVISDLFSMRERGVYLALIGMVWSFATAIGPIIGGAFAQNVSWRWCFYLNLPIEGISLIILLISLDIHNPRTPILEGLQVVDCIGSVALIGATVTFLIGLQFGGTTYAWGSSTVICLIIFGVLLFAAFVFYEWTVPGYPVVPLGICHSVSNAATFIVCISHGITYISVAYFLPLYFQAVLGYDAILSGAWAMIMATVLALSTITPGLYIFKTGKFREPIWFGTVLLTVGFGLFIDWRPFRSYPRMVLYQVIIALGMGPLFQAPLVALQAHLRPEDIAAGTSALAFLRTLSAGIGVIIGQVIYSNRINNAFSYLNTIRLGQLSHGYSVTAARLIKTLPEIEQLVVKVIITDSLSSIWIFYTAMAFVGVVASIFIVPKVLDTTRDEAQLPL